MPSPFVNENTFRQYGYQQYAAEGRMSREGTTANALIYFGLLVTSFLGSWVLAGAQPGLAMVLCLVGLLGGAGMVIWSSFQPAKSPVLAPIYSILEGLALGAISALVNTRFPGIVVNAVLITFGILAAMIGAYRSGFIKVTDKFRTIIFAATAGIAFCYIIDLVLRLFHVQMPFLHDSGPIGIGISLFVIGIASMNLLVDFDNIDRGEQQGLPKYFDSYMAMGLLVTLVWVYIEVLNLLIKLNGGSRDNR